MTKVIGVVKLAPGVVGFYDEISKIHLTISKPKAEVFDYMNTSKLVKAVRNKTLVLVTGSLNATMVVNEEKPVVKEKKVQSLAKEKEQKIEQEIDKIQPTLEEKNEVVVEIIEEIQEEVIEEVKEQPKKKANKKKK